MAVARIGTILSFLCSVTDSHVVYRLHNKAGPWKRTDVIVSHTASGWQNSLLLEWSYNVFFVCGWRHEGKEVRAAEGAYWFQCAMACVGTRGATFVDAVCRQVCSAALQDAGNLCDTWCSFCLSLTFLMIFIILCVYCQWMCYTWKMGACLKAYLFFIFSVIPVMIISWTQFWLQDALHIFCLCEAPNHKKIMEGNRT